MRTRKQLEREARELDIQTPEKIPDEVLKEVVAALKRLKDSEEESNV